MYSTHCRSFRRRHCGSDEPISSVTALKDEVTMMSVQCHLMSFTVKTVLQLVYKGIVYAACSMAETTAVLPDNVT